jgi:hypothetical protein
LADPLKNQAATRIARPQTPNSSCSRQNHREGEIYRLVSDGNTAWGFYTGSGITALGNTVRFSFESVNAAGGPTVGNFLDAADFGVGVGQVPEPATLALLGLGLAGLGFSRRK